MSLFTNLFKGAVATSSTLFSDANIHKADVPVHQPHQGTAAPAKRKKKHAPSPKIRDENQRRQGKSATPARPQSTNSATPVSSVIAQPASRQGPNSRKRKLDGALRDAASEAELDTQPVSGSEDYTPIGSPAEGQASPGKQEIPNEIEDAAATKRTIFVGNVPADTKKSALKASFSQYGSIATVRLRSLPIDNQSKMPRTLQIKAGKVNASAGSANAFIRFKSPEEATAACAANMTVFRDRHLRVDMAARSADPAAAHYPPSRSVFIGNLPLDIQEEDLIEIFNQGDKESQLENSVDAVRVVRDSKTRIGKGIAYIMFKSRVAALTALQLHGTECKSRQMRVTRVEKTPSPGNAQASLKGFKKRSVLSQHHDKKSDEFLGQKHGIAGVKKKKAKDNAAQAGSTSASKKGNGTRVAKRPAVAARKAKALLAAGKVPPPSALAALKKKQKQKKQAQASKSK